MAPQTEVIVTYANIILYAVSYQLQRPVEPFLVRSLIHNRTSENSNNITDNMGIGEEQTYPIEHMADSHPSFHLYKLSARHWWGSS